MFSAKINRPKGSEREKIYLVENENVALIAEIISIGRFLFSFLSHHRWGVRSLLRRIFHMRLSVRYYYLAHTACSGKLEKLFAIHRYVSHRYVPFMSATRLYYILFILYLCVFILYVFLILHNNFLHSVWMVFREFFLFLFQSEFFSF